MFTRRQAVGGAAATALSFSRILGANDRTGLGVIGTGERGIYVMTLFQKNADVQVEALCDVYDQRRDAAGEKAAGARKFTDHRELLAVERNRRRPDCHTGPLAIGWATSSCPRLRVCFSRSPWSGTRAAIPTST